MELAKVTVKGQITIPIEIRRKLGVRNGDKILFVEEAGRIYITNPTSNNFPQEQGAFIQSEGADDTIEKMDSIITVGDVQNG